MLDLQKASLLKRISAFILDAILLVIAISGFAFFLSAVTGFNSYSEKLDEIYTSYEEEYGISPNLNYDQYDKLSDEEKEIYKNVTEAISKDAEANKAYGMVINLTLLITSISILLGYISLEFVVPLIFKNGQTVGKKIFGIALMRTDGVRITAFMLFVRTVLGKYTLETMVPVLIIVMTFFGNAGIIGLAILVLIGTLQIVLIFATKTRSCIHDLLACTVAVDMNSQMIFNTPEELLEYKKKLHADITADSKYM